MRYCDNIALLTGILKESSHDRPGFTPAGVIFALMENLAVFDEVLMAVLDSGKMRIGMWGAHFLFGYERYYRRWLHGPFRPAFTRGELSARSRPWSRSSAR